ncbi:MAG: hypothetical protein WAN58_21590 [Anaerolineales bacterium]
MATEQTFVQIAVHKGNRARQVSTIRRAKGIRVADINECIHGAQSQWVCRRNPNAGGLFPLGRTVVVIGLMKEETIQARVDPVQYQFMLTIYA